MSDENNTDAVAEDWQQAEAQAPGVEKAGLDQLQDEGNANLSPPN